MTFAIIYAKAVDDKDVGVYIEGVYFGGIALEQIDADQIARDCVNRTRGGSAIPKIMPVHNNNSLLEIFTIAKKRFDKLEREMIETETVLESNQRRAKSKRK